MVNQCPPVVIPPVDYNTMEHTDEQTISTPRDSDVHAEETESENRQILQKDPLMLRNLLSYNTPGANEQPVMNDHPLGTEGVRGHTSDCDQPRRSSRASKGNRKLYDASTGTYIAH